MPRVTINGVAIEVPEGTNVVQAAEMSGQEIPHYCYHPGLTVAGNCRMCLVDIRALSDKQPNPLPKLQIGCNTVVQDGMVVESNSEKVEEARRGVLEFLLINHPIDCPICDQAGECKLQEYYMDYGGYHSRFLLEEKVHKRKVLPIGPDVMLDQERCILCTRCVRFLDEVTKTHELCITQRGDHSELTLAGGSQVDNPYATNIVDICPVGALTSREFRFQARVWYLTSTESICAGCANGCNVDVHSRKDSLFRLKPRANAEVNGYWMCDYGRRTYRANGAPERLRANHTRRDGRLVEVSVEDAAARAAGVLESAGRVAIVASANVSFEEGYLLACISARLGGAPKQLLSPPTSLVPDDGLLISTDRYPNRRGLEALGFSYSPQPPSDIAGALIVRADPAGEGEHSGRWQPLLEALACTVVADERATVTAEYADEVLAVASHFESQGSFVNRHGRLQRFLPAMPGPGDSVPGWRALALLLHELGGPSYASAEEIFEAACETLGLGSARSYTWLGAAGRDLELARAQSGDAARRSPVTSESRIGSA